MAADDAAERRPRRTSSAVPAWSSLATLDGSCDSGVVWVVGRSRGQVTTALRAVGMDVHRTWLERHDALPEALLATDVATGTAAAYRVAADGEWLLLPLGPAGDQDG